MKSTRIYARIVIFIYFPVRENSTVWNRLRRLKWVWGQCFLYQWQGVWSPTQFFLRSPSGAFGRQNMSLPNEHKHTCTWLDANACLGSIEVHVCVCSLRRSKFRRNKIFTTREGCGQTEWMGIRSALGRKAQRWHGFQAPTSLAEGDVNATSAHLTARCCISISLFESRPTLTCSSKRRVPTIGKVPMRGGNHVWLNQQNSAHKMLLPGVQKLTVAVVTAR